MDNNAQKPNWWMFLLYIAIGSISLFIALRGFLE